MIFCIIISTISGEEDKANNTDDNINNNRDNKRKMLI